MSTTIRRTLRAGAVAAAAVICGATTAQAYTFASEGAPLSVRDDGKLRGQSYGHLSRHGSNALVLDTRARDLLKKDGRAYSQGNAYRGQDAVRIQTGRRSDGGASFAPLTKTQDYPTVLTGWTGYTKVCIDRDWAPDPCSGQKSGGL